MSRYVEIRYTDCIERVPLDDLSELQGILHERHSFVDYRIRSSFWYGLVHGHKTQVVYLPDADHRRKPL